VTRFGPDATTRPRVIIIIAVIAVALALAWSARPRAETQTERVDRISSELRCVVCQGLSVKDSPSESARQMKAIVVQRVAEGRTDDQIRDEFRANYGDWVVLAPPIASWSGVVWPLPIIAVLAGVAFAGRWTRERSAPLPEAPPAQLAALRERVAREESLDLPVDAS